MNPLRLRQARVALAASCFLLLPALASAQNFLRGDVNRDTRVTISDASYLIYAVEGRKTLDCEDAADVNDNGMVTLQDVVDLLEYLQLPGVQTEPRPPFPVPAPDPTPDEIDCEDPSAMPTLPMPDPDLEFTFETELPPVQGAVNIFLKARTDAPMESFSLVYKIRSDYQVISVDFENTIFPPELREDFEASIFFHWRRAPFAPDPRFDTLSVYAVFVAGQTYHPISFPATQGPLNNERLLRLRLGLPPLEPGGANGGVPINPPTCNVLEPLPNALGPGAFIGGLLTEITMDCGQRTVPTASEREPCISDAGIVFSFNEFVRGNADCSPSTTPDVIDVMYIFTWLYSDRVSPVCEKAMDVDSSDVVDFTDGIFLLNYLYLAGPKPGEPYPACGADSDTSLSISCGDFCGC